MNEWCVIIFVEIVFEREYMFDNILVVKFTHD